MRTGPLLIVLLAGLCSGCAMDQPTPLRVACVGDSITEGYKLPDPATHSYPSRLRLLLPAGSVVGNFGDSGKAMLKHVDLSYWDSPRLPEALAFQPDVVVICLGTNDTAPRFWLPENKPRYEADYLDMVRRFQALPGRPKVYVCLPPPLFPPCPDVQVAQMRNEINPAVRRVAQATGATVIDLDAPLRNRAAAFPDGCHPDQTGAALLAELVRAAITP